MEHTSNLKRIFLFIVICILSNYAFTQGPDITWQKTLKGGSVDVPRIIKALPDGKYVVGGYSKSSIIAGGKSENTYGGATYGDYWVVNLNSVGNISWQNTIGGSGDDMLNTIVLTSDGGYLLGGFSNSNISGEKTENSNGGYDYWLVKINSSGVVQWQNTIGGSGDDYLYGAIETSDGGFIIGGHSNSEISGDKTEALVGLNDIWVLKINASGTIIWQNSIGGNMSELFGGIVEGISGGVVIISTSFSGISGDKTEAQIGLGDYWLFHLNDSGEITWQNSFGGELLDNASCVQQGIDGGYILGGYSSSNISGDKSESSLGYQDFWVIKTDTIGNIIWENTIGGNNTDKLYSITSVLGTGYAIGGSSVSDISPDKSENNYGTSSDYWVLNIDLNGNIIWENTIGGSSTDVLYSLDVALNGAVILAGSSTSSDTYDKTDGNYGSEDYWIIKLNSCFTTYYLDNDADGHGDVASGIVACNSPGENYVLIADDCDDNNFMVKPLAAEWCNAIDDNCNGLIDSEDPVLRWENAWFEDVDGDGFGNNDSPVYDCNAPTGYIAHGDDCDDSNPLIYPGSAEISNGIDDDCSGNIDDADGNFIQWQNTIASDNSKINSIIPTADGGFLIGCSSESRKYLDKSEQPIGGFVVKDYWVIKIDNLGSIVWENTIGGNGEDHITSMCAAQDGGYVIFGSSKSNISGDKTENAFTSFLSPTLDYWVVKINAAGEVVWDETLGGKEDEFAADIVATADGGFVIGGSTESDISTDKSEDNKGLKDFWVVKIDSLGNKIWDNTIGGSNNDILTDIEPLPDGGFLLGGHSNSGVASDKTEASVFVDYWIVKVDANGNRIWDETIKAGYMDYLTKVKYTADGGYILCGYSDSDEGIDKSEPYFTNDFNAYYDYWIVKLDAARNIVWDNTVGGFEDDVAYDIFETQESSFVILGISASPVGADIIYENYYGDAWLIELDSLGNLIWQKTINGSWRDDLDTYPIGNFPATLIKTEDDGFAVGISSWSNVGLDKSEIVYGYYGDPWVLKFKGTCETISIYYDSDGDGFGDPELISGTCDIIPENYVINNLDCNDADELINPTSTEVCNTFDDNCNGLSDEGIVESVTISAGGPIIFCQGGNVTLNSTYTGTSLQWKKAGVAIPGATGPNYVVTSSGAYTCTTTSACASATSTALNVTVNKNPKAVISAGGPTTFCAGGSVTLTETPSAGCSYQWYKGAMSIAGATSATYVANTAGNYKCRVTKIATGCYKTSNSINVSVPCRENETFSLTTDLTFSVYPNPTDSKLFVLLPDNYITENTVINLAITNSLGQNVGVFNLNGVSTEIDLSNLPAGIYYARIQGVEEPQIFIKQ